MKKRIKFLLDKFSNLFFGEFCLECNTQGETICKKCLLKIKREKVSDKIINNISWAKSSLPYNNKIVKRALFLLKYSHNKKVAKYLAEISSKDFLIFLEKIIKARNLDYKDLIILPIPISKKRLIERDYNQTEVLIKEIFLYLKENYDLDLKENLYTNILLKEKHTIKFAHTHSPSERQALIKNAFSINPHFLDLILENKILILVDDITTTGTTFYEARNELLKNNISKENIYAFALSH